MKSLCQMGPAASKPRLRSSFGYTQCLCHLFSGKAIPLTQEKSCLLAWRKRSGQLGDEFTQLGSFQNLLRSRFRVGEHLQNRPLTALQRLVEREQLATRATPYLYTSRVDHDLCKPS